MPVVEQPDHQVRERQRAGERKRPAGGRDRVPEAGDERGYEYGTVETDDCVVTAVWRA